MKRTLIVSIAASVLISACGGGGGSAPVISPDTSLQITSNNAMQVASIVYETALENQQLTDTGGGFFIGSAQGGFQKLDDNLATFAKTGNSGSQVPLPPTTIPCGESGTVTRSGNAASFDTLTAGDYLQLEYSDCNDGFNEVTNGVVRTDVDAFSGDFVNELFSLTTTLTMTNFQISIFENQSTTPIDVLTSNGDATLTVDTTNYPAVSTNISGNSLVVDSNASSESLTNFASTFTLDGNLFPAPYTTSASGTLDSTQLAGVIRYSNPVTFEGLGGDFPSTGEFLVEGLDSSLRLIADNNVDVRIQIDLGADGTIDDTITTTWAELTAP